MYEDSAFDQLIVRLRKFRDDRGWRKFHTPKDLAISISIEAAELLEIFQWEPPDRVIDDESKAKLVDETADVLLYLLMLCDIVDVDIIGAAVSKIDINEARFPAERAFGIAKPPSVE